LRLVRVVRNVEFSRLFDAFFITAISTVLITRFILEITGYPQLGGSALHISHLLPGSLLMLVAILLLLSGVNRAVRDFSALIAGIGFGLVWDEVGKFVTQNNNYFFHATPGLIYSTFVILYLIARYVGQRTFTQDDYLANVIDLIKEAAIKDLDPREYEYAKELMEHVSPDHDLYNPTLQLLEKVKPTGKREPLLIDRIIYISLLPIRLISEQAYFRRLVITVSILYGIVSILTSIFFFYGASAEHLNLAILQGDESDLVGAASALIAAIYVAAGTYWYSRGKTGVAYELFETALLINIFVGQIVLFFKNAGIAIIGLAVALVLLVSVKMIAYEEAHKRIRRRTGI
jgi:hypothetical protein